MMWRRYLAAGVLSLLLLPDLLRADADLLTAAERQWLQAHGPLRYAPDPAFPPFEFLRPNGDAAGITPEILDLLAQHLGTKIQVVHYSNWDAVLAGMKHGEVDLLGTLTRTPDREEYLTYTSSYLTVPNVLWVNSTASVLNGIAEFPGRRIGVVRNSGAHHWLVAQHPEVQAVPVTDAREGFRQLSLNRLDAMLEALPVAAFVIAEQGYTNLRELPEFNFIVPQHLAVRRGDENLRGILEKGLATIPLEARMRIFSRWTGSDPDRPRSFVPPWLLRSLGGLLALLLVVGIWATTLRREVARRTQSLQASEKLFRQLLQDLPVAAAWADETGRMLFFNDKFRTQFGYTLADIKTVEDWFTRAYPDPHYRRQILETRDRNLEIARRQGSNSHGSEVQIVCRDGSIKTIQTTSNVSEGKIFTLYYDITDRQRLELQTRQAQKMEAVGQLAGGVAHDFNNLLTVIMGNATFLIEDPALSEENRQCVRQITEVSQRAASLTRQLLTFSRQQAMQPAPMDLNVTLRSLHPLLARLLGENVAITLACSAEVPTVNADSGMMEQVVINLAVNARDAMARGGTLTLSTEIRVLNSALPVQPTGPVRRGRYVLLTVTDTGSGIAPEAMPRLFEPFFTTKEVGKGTGLGLATVYGIVQQHQGWIEVNSALGKGTAMQVYLPFSELAVPTATDPVAATQSPATGGETILVAEDEEPVRQLAQLCLERSGYRVLAAAHGAAALALWQAHRGRIALLFTDVAMPGTVDGRELANRLTLDDPLLPVVYATGYGREVLEGVPPDAPCLTKPYGPEQLRALIRKCLDQRAVRAGKTPVA